jgi:hypothetical protein
MLACRVHLIHIRVLAFVSLIMIPPNYKCCLRYYSCFFFRLFASLIELLLHINRSGDMTPTHGMISMIMCVTITMVTLVNGSNNVRIPACPALVTLNHFNLTRPPGTIPAVQTTSVALCWTNNTLKGTIIIDTHHRPGLLYF